MKNELFKINLTAGLDENGVAALIADHPKLSIRNDLKLSSYIVFGNMLRTNETIQTLKILILPGLQYFFESGVVQLLFNALKFNKSLESLRMTNCKIGNEEAKDIANLMIANNIINNYNFFGNRIGNEGAALIAYAMSQSKALKSLNLGFNCIGSTGLTKIAEALNNCPSIRELNINFNSPTKAFQCLILKTVVDHPSLTRLDIGDIVGKCPEINEEVYTLLQFNKKISYINKFIGSRRGYTRDQEKDNAINENINNNKQYTPLASALFNKEYNSKVLNDYQTCDKEILADYLMINHGICKIKSFFQKIDLYIAQNWPKILGFFKETDVFPEDFIYGIGICCGYQSLSYLTEPIIGEVETATSAHSII